MAKCPLCDGIVPILAQHPRADAKICDCKTCGTFEISGQVLGCGWTPQEQGRRYHLSALTKSAKTPVMITSETVKRLSDGLFVDPPIPRKIESIVRWVADQSKGIGQKVSIQPAHAYPIATCPTATEWRFLFDEVIKMGYLSGSADEAWVTMQGWQRLTERPNATSSRAFIAMSFAESLKPVKEAIFRAIRAAGYEPIRVDDQEYVGGVMDKIIAFILHWKEGALPDFSTRLTDRILAVMGRGPLAESEN